MFVEPSLEGGCGLSGHVLPGPGQTIGSAIAIGGEGGRVVRVIAGGGSQARPGGATGPVGHLRARALLNTCVGVGLKKKTQS